MKKLIHIFYIILPFAPLLAYILYYTNSEYDFYVYLRICLSILGVGLILECLAFNKKLIIPSFLIPYFLYTLYRILWACVNGEMQRKGVAFYLLYNINIQIILMIIITYNITITSYIKDFIIHIFVIILIVSTLVSIYQLIDPLFLTGYKSDTNINIYQIRRCSIFTIMAPLDLGLTFLPIFSLLVVEYLVNTKNINLILLILFLGGLISVLSNTRWIMVGYLIILLMVIFHYNPKFIGKIRNIMLTIISIIIIIACITYFGYDLIEFWNQRLFPEGSIYYSTRYGALVNFLTFFPQKPWLGTGVHLTDEIYSASKAIGSSQIHVGYLSHLISYGIIGSFFLFSFWLWLAITLWKHAKRTGYWGSFYAFLIYLWGQATWVDYSIMYCGLIFALIFDNYYITHFNNINYNDIT